MEGSQVLRSLELLQLRRDRMAKSSTTVERNQCLIIAMPDLLARLVTLMRVINYAPSVADLTRHNLMYAQDMLNAEMFHFVNSHGGHAGSEWDHLRHLDGVVRRSGGAEAVDAATAAAAAAAAAPAAASAGAGAGAAGVAGEGGTDFDNEMLALLAAFAPNDANGGAGGMDHGPGVDNLTALMGVMQVRQQCGSIGRVDPSRPLLIPLPPPPRSLCRRWRAAWA
jgi:hypothetical protein